jgi:hypothetical protein
LTLRKIGEFTPERLPELTGDLQGNVDAELRRIDAAKLQLVPTQLRGGSVLATLMSAQVTDSSAADVVVRLPRSTPSNAGDVIAIVRLSASNNVMAFCFGQTIDGAFTSALPAARGWWLFLSLGTGWSRHG